MSNQHQHRSKVSLSLPAGQISASEFVDKHNPRVLKRHITEYSLTDDEWKDFQ